MTKKKILCPKCSCIPTIWLDGKNKIFRIKCHNDGLDECKNIEHFLSESIKKDDHICGEHNKDYIWYCSNSQCNKNICLECYEFHSTHESDIICFTKKPKQKEIEKYEEELKILKEEEENFDEITLKFKDLNKHIEKLYILVNETYKNLVSFTEYFKLENLLNKAVLESYDVNTLNYNSILNIKKFKYDKAKITNFKKEIDQQTESMNDLIRKISLKSDNNYINTFITPETDITLKDTINALITFQIDQIKRTCQTKNNLRMELTGEEIEVTNSIKKRQLNYVFKNIEDNNNILGEINYNKEKKYLMFSILSNLENGDFLFHINRESNFTIGKFAWLMKLAALTVDKEIIVINSKQKFNFIVKEDKLLKYKNKNAKCIFMSEEDFDLKNSGNLDKFIYIIISEITPDEWYNLTIKIKEYIDIVYKTEENKKEENHS